MKAKPVKLALIQMSCSQKPAENLAKASAQIRAAAMQGANVIVLPELFLSWYFCQEENHTFFELAEPVPGPTTEALAKLAAELNVAIVASLFERRAPGIYHNTAVVIDAGGQYLGKYRKMHIPDDPLYYEKFYFTPGDLGFKVFATRYGRLGVLVCWDQWYPEAARLTALLGAEVLVYPTAIGWHPSEQAKYGQAQHESWELIQRSHGVANGCFVAAANRVGREVIVGEGLEFWGQSFISDPSGTVLAKGGVATEEIVTADIDLGDIEIRRTHWPFLRDRRIDAYGDLTKRYLDES